MTDPNELSALEAAQRIADGRLTSEALIHTCLERIYAREDIIGAWAHLDADHAVAEAKQCDSEPARGPLHGIPVGIKDIIDTVDMPTAQGSPIYAGNQPAADAACVALLREAGAIILGKTVTTEFAAMTPGKTRNPHNPDHSPGGSSSGSAAAIADFMVPLALGSQTIGSTIRPSTYCGVVGFKSSYGSFSLAGMKPQAPSMDALGLMARSVDDIVLLRALLLGVAQLPDAGPDPVLQPPRIGVSRSPHWNKAESEMVRAIEAAVQALEDSGAALEEIVLEPEFADVLDAQWTILMFECSRGLRYELNNHADALSEPLRNLLEQGRTCPYDEYLAALDLAARCRALIAPIFDRVDVLLTPSAAGPAPLFGAPTDLLFQRLWTVLHLPSITLPAYVSATGLPVGIQLVGGLGSDSNLLSIARWVEERVCPATPI